MRFTPKAILNCTVCGHPNTEHGRHEEFVDIPEGDKRELCLLCPGYTLVTDEPGS